MNLFFTFKIIIDRVSFGKSSLCQDGGSLHSFTFVILELNFGHRKDLPLVLFLDRRPLIFRLLVSVKCILYSHFESVLVLNFTGIYGELGDVLVETYRSILTIRGEIK
jgi:hypothetical protein